MVVLLKVFIIEDREIPQSLEAVLCMHEPQILPQEHPDTPVAAPRSALGVAPRILGVTETNKQILLLM